VKTGLSVELLAHYAGNAHTLARLWKITRRDAQVFGFTDHDRAITFDGTDYEPSSIFDLSAVETGSQLATDNAEAKGLLDSAGITAADIEAGLWDGAAVEIREVNWRDLTMGANILRVGELGNIKRDGPRYTAELFGLMDRLKNNIGRVIKPMCDADLGDERCGVDLEALRVSGVVEAVTSNRVFDTDLAAAAGFYTYGVITWTSGLNTGRSMEVKLHGASGALTLQLAMPDTVAVADAFTIVPGCDKLKATCIGTYNNLVNFRGFSFVPGPDRAFLRGDQQ
jgi:uncharacterized phage protein (TIGR02218 family)